jgi:hypothetical protein
MMARSTADLIQRLAGDSPAVRRLRRPSVRAVMWCAVSLTYLWLLYSVWPHTGLNPPSDRSFIVEQAAAFATGLSAAVAAFAMVVPGSSRRLVLAPLVPLGVWAGSVGQMCARDWSSLSHLPPILIHWGCFPATIVAGFIPTVAIVFMLRRGAPMSPRLTTALAGLAVAGMANFGIRFVHASDPSFVVLAWHLAAIFGLSAVATSFGHRMFSWRQTLAASRVGA